MCISLVIIVQMTTPGGIEHLREQADLSVIFLALIFVVAITRNQSASRIPRLMEFATALTSLAAVIVAIAEVHIAWQGRVLGYGFLLFGSAHLAPKIRGMSDRAPEAIAGRVKWYLALWGLEMLAIAMFAQAWSLTMPIRFRGDLVHPPVHGLLIVPLDLGGTRAQLSRSPWRRREYAMGWAGGLRVCADRGDRCERTSVKHLVVGILPAMADNQRMTPERDFKRTSRAWRSYHRRIYVCGALWHRDRGAPVYDVEIGRMLRRERDRWAPAPVCPVT